jgi:hypothetical protein
MLTTLRARRRGSASRAIGVASPACALLAAACTVLYPYPAQAPELCAGGVDEDLDGLIDCDDPDCDGMCPESGIARCSDGRDNDLDGLVDFVDPRCWQYARITVDRCALIAGSSANVVADSFDPTWSRDYSVEVVHDSALTDPEDPETPVLRDGVVSSSPLSGAWAGTTLHARVRAGSQTLVELVPTDGGPVLSLRVTSSILSMAVADELGGQWGSGISARAILRGSSPAHPPLPPGWRTLDLRLEPTGSTIEAHASLSADTGESVAIQMPAPVGWPEGGAMTVRISLYDTSGDREPPSLLGHTTVDRLAYDPCESPRLPTMIPAGTLVRIDDESACVIGSTLRGPPPFGSDGLDWPDPWSAIGARLGTERRFDAAARLPMNGRLIRVVGDGGGSVGWSSCTTSADCAAGECLETSVFPGRVCTTGPVLAIGTVSPDCAGWASPADIAVIPVTTFDVPVPYAEAAFLLPHHYAQSAYDWLELAIVSNHWLVSVGIDEAGRAAFAYEQRELPGFASLPPSVTLVGDDRVLFSPIGFLDPTSTELPSSTLFVEAETDGWTMLDVTLDASGVLGRFDAHGVYGAILDLDPITDEAVLTGRIWARGSDGSYTPLPFRVSSP